MLELRQRFIDLAVRPLAGKEAAGELARAELMERLNHAVAGAADDPIEVAVPRLEQPAPVSPRRWAAGVFAALAGFLVVLGFLTVPTWREMQRVDGFYDLVSDRSHREMERALAKGRSEQERLFLFSDTYLLGLEEKRAWLEACEQKLPDDPGWLEDYAPHRRPLPAEYFAHARRIDPGNGLWDLIAARDALSRSNFSFRSRGGKTPPPPVLVTDDRYRTAIAMIEQAVAQPRIQSRAQARTAERLTMLGPAKDVAELADRLNLAASQRRFSSSDYKSAELWTVRAQELRLAGDMDGLRRWIGTWETLMNRSLQESQGVSSVSEYTSPRVADELQKVAAEAGLTEEESRLARWHAEFRKPLAGSTSMSIPDLYLRAAAFDRGGWIYHSGSFLVETVDWGPGRRAERAMADRMLALTGAALFGILAAFAAVEGWRRNIQVRGLADGLWPLIRPVDFGWLVGFGILLPAAWHAAIDGLSPLGGRDLSVTAWELIPALGRAGGSFLLATCLIVQTARWRLARRGGLIGLRPSLWQGWALAVVAALFVPAMGAVRHVPSYQEEYVRFGSAAAGLPLLWLLWRGFALLFCPRPAALGGVLVCRMVAPCFLLAGSLLVAATPLLKRQEEKWIARDQVAQPDPRGSGLNVINRTYWDLKTRQLRGAME